MFMRYRPRDLSSASSLSSSSSSAVLFPGVVGVRLTLNSSWLRRPTSIVFLVVVAISLFFAVAQWLRPSPPPRVFREEVEVASTLCSHLLSDPWKRIVGVEKTRWILVDKNSYRAMDVYTSELRCRFPSSDILFVEDVRDYFEVQEKIARVLGSIPSPSKRLRSSTVPATAWGGNLEGVEETRRRRSEFGALLYVGSCGTESLLGSILGALRKGSVLSEDSNDPLPYVSNLIPFDILLCSRCDKQDGLYDFLRGTASSSLILSYHPVMEQALGWLFGRVIPSALPSSSSKLNIFSPLMQRTSNEENVYWAMERASSTTHRDRDSSDGNGILIISMNQDSCDSVTFQIRAIQEFWNRLRSDDELTVAFSSGDSFDCTDDEIKKFISGSSRKERILHIRDADLDLPWTRGSPGGYGDQRIAYLAMVRNRIIETVEKQLIERKLSTSFRAVIFMNDVFVDAAAIETLLRTPMSLIDQGAEAQSIFNTFSHERGFEDGLFDVQNLPPVDVVCGMDYAESVTTRDGLILYDIWVGRDISGAPFDFVWPYVRHLPSREALLSNRPFRVQSCWNGIVMVRGNLVFPRKRVREFIDVPLVRFRAHAPHECAASECEIMFWDLRTQGRGFAVVNPRVRVGYSLGSFQKVRHAVHFPVLDPLPLPTNSSCSAYSTTCGAFDLPPFVAKTKERDRLHFWSVCCPYLDSYAHHVPFHSCFWWRPTRDVFRFDEDLYYYPRVRRSGRFCRCNPL